MNEQDLMTEIPWINWRVPVKITTPSHSTDYGCRFCIAMCGLKGEDVKLLPKTWRDFVYHMRFRHKIDVEGSEYVQN